MMNERMPPLAAEAMSEEQKRAAAELAAGPRGGVRGPFIALLRSPGLMRPLQKVGEYLRFETPLERRLAEGARPRTMADDEARVYDFCAELLHSSGVAGATYQRAIQVLGERGVVDLVGLVGYFITVSLVMNVAHTPAGAAPLEPFPR